MPVAGDLVDPARIIRTACARIGGVGVDGIPSRENDRVVIIVKLTGEEIGSGKAVILRAMVPVVLVRGGGDAAKAAVREKSGGNLLLRRNRTASPP